MDKVFESVQKPVKKVSYDGLFSHKSNNAKTCSKCGCTLAADEIDICKNCLK
jgi:hypothetical protein